MLKQKVIVGTHTNIMNKDHIPRWVDFHSLYADKLVLVIHVTDAKQMKDEIKYAEDRGVLVEVTNFCEPDYAYLRLVHCQKLIQSMNPDWMGIIATDEIFERVITDEDLSCDENCLSFKIYHLWGSKSKYRVDHFWGRSMNNTRENIRLWRNVFGLLISSEQGVHCSLSPHAVKTSTIKEAHNSIIHYAFIDTSQWDKRVANYGDGYEKGGSHDGYDKTKLPELLDMPRHIVVI
jgi:hypothetical protein